MRIALVRYGYSATGGAEAYLRRLASGLADAGEEVVLYSSEDWPRETWSFGEILTIPARSPLSFAKALASLKKEVDCLFSMERIFSCDVYRAGDGVHEAWLQRRAQFEPFHCSISRLLNPKQRQILKLERSVFDPQQTGIVIANSEMVKEEILRYYTFPTERIVLIPNGFQAIQRSPEDRTRIRNQYGFSADETLVLFTGSGWERKGLRFAIRAIHALGGRARLLVTGKGPAEQYASRYTVFAGAVSEMAPFYEAADIFILPTLYDPFSNACLEALAAGLPVITTDANGFSEVLQTEELGAKVAIGDEKGLVQALERWLPRKARNSTRRVRLEMAKRFSMKENIRKTLEAIHLSLEMRNGRALCGMGLTGPIRKGSE